MNILHTTPAIDGFHMPGEYEPHYGCLIIWPESAESWTYGGYNAKKAFAQVAAAIGKSEKVTVCVSHKQYASARKALPPYVRVVEMSTNDSWARDYAPTFVIDKDRNMRGINWKFNAWGGLVDGLYFPWDKDDAMAIKVCDLFDKDCYDCTDFVLEGGSIAVDGEGTVIVTENCLLSAGRNPDMSQSEIEEKLKEYLGVTKVIWLRYGIYNDETNEHVDNVCAYVKPGHVILAWTDDENDPQYAMSKHCLDILENTTDALGRKITVTKLPVPKPVLTDSNDCEGLDDWGFDPTRTDGERLAASYVNFYISNDSIVVPGFNNPDSPDKDYEQSDKCAVDILKELFPNRKIVQIYARDILIGGGNIHCITQQIPASKEA